MKKLIFILLALVVSFTILTSCDKEEETEKVEYKQPGISTKSVVIQVPAALQTSQNPNAVFAASMMTLANSVASLAGSFTVPTDASPTYVTDGAVYNWTYSGYSYWMSYNESALKNTWKYEYEFPGVARFTYMTAEETKDSKSGNWKVYSPEGSHPLIWDYTWNINSSNTFTAVLNFTDEETNEQMKFEVVSNADNSGNFKYYEGADKKAEITWTANGTTGNWWVKDDGGQINTGTW